MLPQLPHRRRRPHDGAAGTISLNGYYRFDDEGVRRAPGHAGREGRPPQLPQEPHPREGASPRTATAAPRGRSTRSAAWPTPSCARAERVPYAKLKELLLAEVRRQRKAFGLIIADISGGQTNTTTYDYQAFKGMPRIVYRVDAQDRHRDPRARRRDRRARRSARSTGSSPRPTPRGVFNGFCGAESGFVPVSTVAPAVLISEIELQRTRRAMERPPILPAPWRSKQGPSPLPLPLRARQSSQASLSRARSLGLFGAGAAGAYFPSLAELRSRTSRGLYSSDQPLYELVVFRRERSECRISRCTSSWSFVASGVNAGAGGAGRGGGARCLLARAAQPGAPSAARRRREEAASAVRGRRQAARRA